MDSPLPKDGQGNPFFDTDLGLIQEKTITFTAGGDGAVGAITLFTVTGVVKVQLFGLGVTNTTIETGAKIEAGVSGTTAGLIAQTAADAPDVGEIWHDAAPDAKLEALSVLTKRIITSNIIQTIGTDTVNSGAITYFCLWSPISANGNVVAA